MMVGQQQKDQAEKWFKDLRDKICKEFETLETDHLKLFPINDILVNACVQRSAQG